VEQHVILGDFKYPLKKGINRVEIRMNIRPDFVPADVIFENRRQRYKTLTEKSGFTHPQILRLVQASDDFIVHRKNTGKKTIIAGYPWFTDWGRDTMIALPGLTLATGRFKEASEMIEGFLSKAFRGIIPNNFPDEGEDPMYNTSDGTLWLFNAVNDYYKHTKDRETIKKIFPDLIGIIKHHINGTINDIYMDSDGLLNTGNEATQLTWMDVKVNGWVVTPRHGKAVEINALWYNAIRIVIGLAEATGQEAVIDRMQLKQLADQIFESFNKTFWNDEKKRLYDLVIEGQPVDIPRPNMIFAVSLANPVLNPDRWEAVVSYVEKEFKVPYGLLTLTREDPDFHGQYRGDLLSRDGAYHRGTAWGWLIGPFLEAHYKTFSDRNRILDYLDESFKHLDEGVHGSYSEIFEGEAPHAQRGCSAQAWSVAEILRIWWLIHNQE
jgi:predicted glycogen debranching enzyme